MGRINFERLTAREGEISQVSLKIQKREDIDNGKYHQQHSARGQQSVPIIAVILMPFRKPGQEQRSHFPGGLGVGIWRDLPPPARRWQISPRARLEERRPSWYT
ncbi:MAG: hypothetical protein ACXVB7_20150 [Ktedonobacteraceae bacterium]